MPFRKPFEAQVSVRYDPQAFKFKKMKDEVADAVKEDWKRARHGRENI